MRCLIFLFKKYLLNQTLFFCCCFLCFCLSMHFFCVTIFLSYFLLHLISFVKSDVSEHLCVCVCFSFYKLNCNVTNCGHVPFKQSVCSSNGTHILSRVNAHFTLMCLASLLSNPACEFQLLNYLLKNSMCREVLTDLNFKVNWGCLQTFTLLCSESRELIVPLGLKKQQIHSLKLMFGDYFWLNTINHFMSLNDSLK